LNPGDVKKNPVLRFIFIFLDMIDFLREGKEPRPTDLDTLNGEPKSAATKAQAGSPAAAHLTQGG
jgi:hypothetical protein